MKCILESLCFRLKISEEIFLSLLKRETADYNFSITLIKEIEELGGVNVDWNGHFGSAIFFEIDIENIKNRGKIIKLIKERLE